MNNLPYIFIIGFNKTATRSLNHFFESNGFPGVHWDHGLLARAMQKNLIEEKKIFAGYDHHYKVYSDMTFVNYSIFIEANEHFRIMDRDYPGSYFIYNNRDTEKWLTSRMNHNIGDKHSLVARSQSIYNTKHEANLKEIWRTRKQRFEQDIRGYFSGCERFLEIDVEKDEVCLSISNLLGMKLDCSHWKTLGKTKKNDLYCASATNSKPMQATMI